MLGSKTVTDLLLGGLNNVVGACFAVEPDPAAATILLIRHVRPNVRLWDWIVACKHQVLRIYCLN